MSRTYFVANDGELHSTDLEGVTVRVAEGWRVQGIGDEEDSGGLVEFNGKIIFAASRYDPETGDGSYAVFSADPEGVVTQLSELFAAQRFPE